MLRDASRPFSLSDFVFKSIYRLSKEIARSLIDDIQVFLPERRPDISLPDDLIILCALHFYAQGSYQKSVGQDLYFPMCQASVSNCLSIVTDILNDHFIHLIKFPTSEEEKIIEKRKFMALPSGFPGIIGAIDGTHIKIHPPHDEQNPGILFLNRKGFYSLNVMCIAGADLKILAINARYPGSVHDSAVWATSQIKVHLRNAYNEGMTNSWLLGDSGYPLEPWLMTPVNGRAEDVHIRNYNIAHRSLRNVVERLFGVMKARFRCCFGERALHYKPEKAGRIINACAILHNICINRGDRIDDFVDDELPNENFEDEEYYNNERYNEDGAALLDRGRIVRERIINQYF